MTPRNVALVLIGSDQDPEWEVAVLQDDGREHVLMQVRSDDATGVGYLLAHAASGMGIRLDLRCDRRGPHA